MTDKQFKNLNVGDLVLDNGYGIVIKKHSNQCLKIRFAKNSEVWTYNLNIAHHLKLIAKAQSQQ